MDFRRKYDTRIPQITAWIHEFLRTKHLTGQVEYEFQSANEPTGWAILTVDTTDPKLQTELDGFISNLERIAALESEPGLTGRSQNTPQRPSARFTKSGSTTVPSRQGDLSKQLAQRS